MASEAVPEPIAGEPLLHRPARALVGWLGDQEAVQALLGRGPVPSDELSPLQQTVTSCRSAVERRAPYRVEDPLVPGDKEYLESIAARTEVKASFAGLEWRPAFVDLSRVLSFQKIIHTDGLEERLVGAVESQERLNELCIPMAQPSPPLGAFTDADGKGFTISSFNPNLRIAGGQLADAKFNPAPGLPPVKMQAVTLLVYMGTSYLQVVRYKGRCFIRDGYHRAAGLVRLGANNVPCIFIEAERYDQVGAAAGAFSYEILFGDRPPKLLDFWDEEVSKSIKQVSVRKVIRVRGEEFVVPR